MRFLKVLTVPVACVVFSSPVFAQDSGAAPSASARPLSSSTSLNDMDSTVRLQQMRLLQQQIDDYYSRQQEEQKNKDVKNEDVRLKTQYTYDKAKREGLFAGVEMPQRLFNNIPKRR